MTMKNESLIIENLKTLTIDVREIRKTVPRIAAIEEHLKNLNGSVQRHEQSIGGLDDVCDKQDRRIDKIYTVATFVSALSGIVFGIVSSVFYKIFFK